MVYSQEDSQTTDGCFTDATDCYYLQVLEKVAVLTGVCLSAPRGEMKSYGIYLNDSDRVDISINKVDQSCMMVTLLAEMTLL